MTDKERAKKYADNNFCGQEAQAIAKVAFKDGAEFGYNKAYNKAKELIKEILSILPKENIEGIYEITEEAEEFIKG